MNASFLQHDVRATNRLRFSPALAIAVLMFAQSLQAADGELQRTAPLQESVKAKAIDWLRQKTADAGVVAKAGEMWTNAASPLKEEELLDRLATTFALADRDCRELVALCARPRAGLALSDQTWLGDKQTPPFVACNMRLYYARWLVHQSLFEEARDQLSGLQPADVVAPAMLLFYQGVVCQMLLEKEPGLKALEQLLSGGETTPRRYIALARLMQDDLKGLEEDSLDHIARRMDDIRRRLDLGRTGAKVCKVEDGVIESLDKLIKKIEDQQQEQEQSLAGENVLRPTSPARDSMPMGGKGPGDVTKKDIGSQSDWGDLPPKEREEALQQIGRDFPAHYRDVIEQYFKRLASESDEK